MKNRPDTGQLYKYKSDTGQLYKDMEENGDMMLNKIHALEDDFAKKCSCMNK